jgi:ribonucleoside-diphosphate reductase alpha chain
VAADILAQKYFRKAGVPARLKKVEENSVPSWLWRSVADEEALAELPEDERYGSETDARQVFDRLAGTWTYWGWKGGYFTCGRRRARLLSTSCATCWPPSGAPNSPQWFNTGLHWAYGIDGPGQGHFYVDFTGKLTKSKSPTSTRSRMPASSSRSPTIWSTKAASWTCGCVKRACSNTAPAPAPTSPSARRRREAVGRRQVVGPDELPEDRRPRRRRHQVGRHHAPRGQDGRGRHRPPRYRGLHRLEGQGRAEGRRPCHRLEDRQEAPERHHEGLRELRGRQRLLRPGKNPALKREIKAAKKAQVPENYIKRVIQFAARATPTSSSRPTTPTGIREAYLTVSGQNSNNSVRVKDDFLRAVEERRRLGPDRTARTAR